MFCGKKRIYPMLIICLLSIVAMAIANIFNGHINSDARDFINGFGFGINLLAILLIIVRLNSRRREKLEILLNDERIKRIKLVSLSLTFGISFFSFIILGVVLLMTNYEFYGKIFIGAALYEEAIAIICGVFLYIFM
jgi:uncharacterized membrane protein